MNLRIKINFFENKNFEELLPKPAKTMTCRSTWLADRNSVVIARKDKSERGERERERERDGIRKRVCKCMCLRERERERERERLKEENNELMGKECLWVCVCANEREREREREGERKRESSVQASADHGRPHRSVKRQEQKKLWTTK